MHKDLRVQLDYQLQYVEQENTLYCIVNESHNLETLVNDVNVLHVNLEDLLLLLLLDFLQHYEHYTNLHEQCLDYLLVLLVYMQPLFLCTAVADVDLVVVSWFD